MTKTFQQFLKEDEQEPKVVDRKQYLAKVVINGEMYDTTAYRKDSKWFVGGDSVEQGVTYLIQMEISPQLSKTSKNYTYVRGSAGRTAWFKLQGNRLIFQDYVG